MSSVKSDHCLNFNSIYDSHVVFRLYVTEYNSPGNLGIQHKRLKEGQWEMVRPFENRNLSRALRTNAQFTKLMLHKLSIQLSPEPDDASISLFLQ